MKSIFPVLSMNRDKIKWEHYLGDLTPVENNTGVWFKREDYFAPLGYGGPNGSKLRQLIWLINRGRAGKSTVLSGASVKSPQLSMSTIVGRHYGLGSELIIGATNKNSALRHSNVAIASRFGARFHIVNVAYNPYLQKMVQGLRREDTLVVEYGITLEHSRHSQDEVSKFHLLGAEQVKNIPSTVETLIVPAGSCNSLVSVLVGLINYNKSVKHLRTYGIGPDKMHWVRERMAFMGYDVEHLDRDWQHINLQEIGYCDYQMEIPFDWDGGAIRFHPTYEGKMMSWLAKNNPIPRDDKHMVWIVGSRPDVKILEPFFTSIEKESVEVI